MRPNKDKLKRAKSWEVWRPEKAMWNEIQDGTKSNIEIWLLPECKKRNVPVRWIRYGKAAKPLNRYIFMTQNCIIIRLLLVAIFKNGVVSTRCGAATIQLVETSAAALTPAPFAFIHFGPGRATKKWYFETSINYLLVVVRLFDAHPWMLSTWWRQH